MIQLWFSHLFNFHFLNSVILENHNILRKIPYKVKHHDISRIFLKYDQFLWMSPKRSTVLGVSQVYTTAHCVGGSYSIAAGPTHRQAKGHLHFKTRGPRRGCHVGLLFLPLFFFCWRILPNLTGTDRTTNLNILTVEDHGHVRTCESFK